MARGVRRMTTDVDVVIDGPSITTSGLVDVLLRHAIRPRIPDAITFAEANLVLLARHEPTGVDLDLSFAWTTFERDAIRESARGHFGAIELPIASAENLVVLKAMASRPKDLEDAAALLLLHPEIDRTRVRRRVLELAELADAPEIGEGLEALLERAKSTPKARKRDAGTRRNRR